MPFENTVQALPGLGRGGPLRSLPQASTRSRPCLKVPPLDSGPIRKKFSLGRSADGDAAERAVRFTAVATPICEQRIRTSMRSPTIESLGPFLKKGFIESRRGQSVVGRNWWRRRRGGKWWLGFLLRVREARPWLLAAIDENRQAPLNSF